ncbi:MAG: hypothetical protein HC765_00020 [Brachymonas sp.]|nr:hypothetical protein [Brachymonas sp.]
MEDGLYALRILGQQLRLAGFNPVQPGRLTASPSNEPLRNPAPWGTSTLPIFACSSGFANAENTATFTGISISALTCSTTNTTSHAIAVTYEADIYNTEPTAAPALPTDCTGSSLPMQTTMTVPGRPHNYYYVENRFYVKNNSLFCTGNGGGTVYAPPTQPLIANIEQLNFQFGVMMPTTTNIITIPVGYLDAAQIGSSSGVDATANVNLQTYDATNRWDKISTVVICVLMRSNREILADPAPTMAAMLRRESSCRQIALHGAPLSVPLTCATAADRVSYAKQHFSPSLQAPSLS